MHERIEMPHHKPIRRRIGWIFDYDFDAASMKYVYRVILLCTAILRNPSLVNGSAYTMRLIANQEFLFERGRR